MAFLNKNNGWYDLGCSYDPLKHNNIVWNFLDTLNGYETAQNQNFAEHCVRDCMRRFLECGTFLPRPKGHRASKIDEDMTLMLLLLMKLFPTAHPDEYQIMITYFMNFELNEVPSISAIGRTLKQCGITDKKLSKIYAERFRPRNMESRWAFLQWRALQQLQKFYFLDVTGIYERDGSRRQGWSIAGERIVYPQAIGNARKRWNVIVMVGFSEGVVNAYPLQVNVTWDVFRAVFVAAFLDFIPLAVSYVWLTEAFISTTNWQSSVLRGRSHL